MVIIKAGTKTRTIIPIITKITIMMVIIRADTKNTIIKANMEIAKAISKAII